MPPSPVSWSIVWRSCAVKGVPTGYVQIRSRSSPVGLLISIPMEFGGLMVPEKRRATRFCGCYDRDISRLIADAASRSTGRKSCFIRLNVERFTSLATLMEPTVSLF